MAQLNMLSSILFLLVAWTNAIPLLMHTKRDAPFEAVRTKLLQHKSGVRGDSPLKYFHESTFHSHYDGRFADKPLPAAERRNHLIALVQTYFSSMNDIGAQTWIMHGSLLGWWWNRKIMPWDSDIDVQMSESSIRYLADYYNMTVHHYKFKDAPGGRDYLLEINPNYTNDSTADWMNVIDARWIDMDSGLFIDITTLRVNRTAEAEGTRGMMMCKDKHWFWEGSIYPLRDSLFENIPVKVPHSYTELLEEEYGPASLTRTVFEGHKFDSEKMEWVPIAQLHQDQMGVAVPGGPVTHHRDVSAKI